MDTGEPRGDSPSLPPAPGACSASIIDEGPTLSPFASQQDTLFGVAEDAKRQRRMQKQRFSSTGSRLRRKYASKGMMEDDPLDNLARETRAFVRDQQEIRLTSAITVRWLSFLPVQAFWMSPRQCACTYVLTEEWRCGSAVCRRPVQESRASALPCMSERRLWRRCMHAPF